MNVIYNFYEELRSALSKVKSVKTITRGWPKQFASRTLPCIAIVKASETPADYRDDRERITEVEYYIRIFADKFEQVDEIVPQVHEIMERLGWQRTMTYDADDSAVRIAHLRYRKYV